MASSKTAEEESHWSSQTSGTPQAYLGKQAGPAGPEVEAMAGEQQGKREGVGVPWEQGPEDQGAEHRAEEALGSGASGVPATYHAGKAGHAARLPREQGGHTDQGTEGFAAARPPSGASFPPVRTGAGPHDSLSVAIGAPPTYDGAPTAYRVPASGVPLADTSSVAAGAAPTYGSAPKGYQAPAFGPYSSDNLYYPPEQPKASSRFEPAKPGPDQSPGQTGAPSSYPVMGPYPSDNLFFPPEQTKVFSQRSAKQERDQSSVTPSVPSDHPLTGSVMPAVSRDYPVTGPYSSDNVFFPAEQTKPPQRGAPRPGPAAAAVQPGTPVHYPVTGPYSSDNVFFYHKQPAAVEAKQSQQSSGAPAAHSRLDAEAGSAGAEYEPESEYGDAEEFEGEEPLNVLNETNASGASLGVSSDTAKFGAFDGIRSLGQSDVRAPQAERHSEPVPGLGQSYGQRSLEMRRILERLNLDLSDLEDEEDGEDGEEEENQGVPFLDASSEGWDSKGLGRVDSGFARRRYDIESVEPPEFSEAIQRMKGDAGAVYRDLSRTGSQQDQFLLAANEEVVRISGLLTEREKEMAAVVRELEETKAKLAVLQARADTELAAAQRAVVEKDEELKGVESTMGALAKVGLEYWGSGNQVKLAGSFNGWRHHIPLTPDLTSEIHNPDGSRGALLWETTLWLYPGEYEVKFIVDGVWTVDPRREVTHGGLGQNNVIKVEKPGQD